MSRLVERCRQRGFSVFLISVILLGLGLALVVALSLLPNTSDRADITGTIGSMEDTQHNVLAFVVENYRLPLPDIDIPGTPDYGYEDAAGAGALPFRDMRLPEDARDEIGLPLRYAPYRNAGDFADLAVATSLFAPANGASELRPTQKLPNPSSYGCSLPVPPSPSPVNLLDFCVALENGRSASAPPNSAHVNTGPGVVNAAYVLVSGGLEDADGDQADLLLDGANDDADVNSYENPARGREQIYDDLVRAMPFESLERELSCSALLTSLDILLYTTDDLRFQADLIATQLHLANIQVALNTAGSIQRLIALANTVIAASGDAQTTTKICANPLAAVQCAAAAALTVVSVAVSVAAAVDLIIFATIAGDTEDVRDEVSDLNDEARTHVCDAIEAVVAADHRGGLL